MTSAPDILTCMACVSRKLEGSSSDRLSRRSLPTTRKPQELRPPLMYYSTYAPPPPRNSAEALNLVEGLSSRQLIDEARLVLELLADAQLARFAARVALARGMCRLDPACFRERPSCLTNPPRAALERIPFNHVLVIAGSFAFHSGSYVLPYVPAHHKQNCNLERAEECFTWLANSGPRFAKFPLPREASKSHNYIYRRQ